MKKQFNKVVRIPLLFSLSFLVLSTVGCGVALVGFVAAKVATTESRLEPEFEPDVNLKGPIGNIKFDNTIDPKHYRLIAKDLHALAKMSFSDEGGKTARLMKISRVSPAEIKKWTEDRIQFFVSEKFRRGFPAGKTILADNWSSTMYRLDKEFPNTPATQGNIPGYGSVTITSPRTGIIRLGPALFEGLDSKLEQTQSRMRWSTYAHEGRHGDGDLVFFHILCPKGHSYEDQYACDDSLNGAYTIGAVFLKSALKGCKECTAHGKELMRLSVADDLSRVIHFPGILEKDDAPVGCR